MKRFIPAILRNETLGGLVRAYKSPEVLPPGFRG
jgi:hypothetical protein